MWRNHLGTCFYNYIKNDFTSLFSSKTGSYDENICVYDIIMLNRKKHMVVQQILDKYGYNLNKTK